MRRTLTPPRHHGTTVALVALIAGSLFASSASASLRPPAEFQTEDFRARVFQGRAEVAPAGRRQPRRPVDADGLRRLQVLERHLHDDGLRVDRPKELAPSSRSDSSQ